MQHRRAEAETWQGGARWRPSHCDIFQTLPEGFALASPDQDMPAAAADATS
jgi:hypothetical protein